MLVMCSLYYTPDITTGANKRFEQLALELSNLCPKLYLVVRKGCHVPSLSKSDVIYIEIPDFFVLKRVFDFVCLSALFLFFRLKNFKVISDYNPIPPTLFFSSKQYQLIHDARLFDSFIRWGRFSRFFMKLQWRSLNNIVTVSYATKNALLDKMPKLNRQGVVVSYNGLSDAYFSQTLQPDIVRNIDVFYLATFEKRKNHTNLIKALDSIPSPLVIVFMGRDLGEKAEVVRLLDTYCKQHTISIVESMDEQALLDLYARVKLFVSPSFYEGFGMPLIEAKLRGCEVCCSDIAVFHEVMDADAVYFDPHSIDSISKCISAQLAEYNSLSVIKSHNEVMGRLKSRYLWRNIAAKLIDDL